MRIVVLEWISGGGLTATPIEQIPISLRSEGWAMLQQVALGLARCGYAVEVCLDSRWRSTASGQQLAQQCSVTSVSQWKQELPEHWCTLACECDLAIVIAPEIDGLLERVLDQLQTAGARLANCRSPFLRAACDKRLTAELLVEFGVLHPATCPLSDLTDAWLDQHESSSGRWMMKPYDGAGCDALKIFSGQDLRGSYPSLKCTSHANRAIIQPFVEGTSYSRSAIVDRAGDWHWLPLVTQDFEQVSAAANGTSGMELKYLGGRVLPSDAASYLDAHAGLRFNIDVLNQTLTHAVTALGAGAMGWVGVDLVYSDGAWIVIEINPRLTTSMLGLARASHDRVLDQLVRACVGQRVVLDETLPETRFRAECEAGPQ